MMTHNNVVVLLRQHSYNLTLYKCHCSRGHARPKTDLTLTFNLLTQHLIFHDHCDQNQHFFRTNAQIQDTFQVLNFFLPFSGPMKTLSKYHHVELLYTRQLLTPLTTGLGS